MRVLSNLESLHIPEPYSYKVDIIQNKRELFGEIKKDKHPLLVLTDKFIIHNELLLDYTRRDYSYELVIINKKAGVFSIEEEINSDVLGVINESISQFEWGKIINRYQFRRKLFVPHSYEAKNEEIRLNSNTFIKPEEILFMRAYGNYLLIFTLNGRLVERETLISVCEKLPQNSFIQTHRSFVVNIQHITELKMHSLKIGNETIPISARKRSEVIEILKAQNITYQQRSSQNS